MLSTISSVPAELQFPHLLAAPLGCTQGSLPPAEGKAKHVACSELYVPTRTQHPTWSASWLSLHGRLADHPLFAAAADFCDSYGNWIWRLCCSVKFDGSWCVCSKATGTKREAGMREGDCICLVLLQKKKKDLRSNVIAKGSLQWSSKTNRLSMD